MLAVIPPGADRPHLAVRPRGGRLHRFEYSE